MPDMTLNREPNVHQEEMERSEIATVDGIETHLDNLGAPANDFEEIKAVMSAVLKPSPHPDQSIASQAMT